MDRKCRLSPDSKLVQSAGSGPVLIAVGSFAPQDNANKLKDAGCEILVVPEEGENQSLGFVLKELGNRRFTNVLLEGGSTLLGSAFDAGLIDEVHCFIAPKIVGGHNAMRPVDGVGKGLMEQAAQLSHVQIECLENDVHIHGFVDRR
jgi:diaminohydroxyphosphoribosylaminopyrimidine deaminase/5-amino-6-(5-phosphoribosylamino)uracil reductase